MSVDNSWQRGANKALTGAQSLITKLRIPSEVSLANGIKLRRLTFGEVLNKDQLTRCAQEGVLYKLVTGRRSGKLGAKRVSVEELRLLCFNQQYAAIMQLFWAR